MSTVAFVDGVVTLNTVDLSDHLKSASISVDGVELDASSIASSWDVTKMGRKSFSLAIEAMDDFAASNVDATIWAAFNAGTPIAFTFRATSASKSTTNPEYSGSVIPSHSPVGGGAGDLLMKSVTFKGTGALTRATS